MAQEIVVAERTKLGQIALQSEKGGASLVPQHLGEVVDFAMLMSKADCAVPVHLRQNPGACLAVAMNAFRRGWDPFALAAKTYLVAKGAEPGQIAYEAQAVAAMIIDSPIMKRRPRYEYLGEGGKRTCKVTFFTTDNEEYEWLSPEFDRIHPKNSPLWKSDPDQQQGYYSIRGGARRHFPDIIMGVYTREEIQAGMDDRAEGGGQARSFDQMETLAAPKEEGKPALPEGYGKGLEPVDAEVEGVQDTGDGAAQSAEAPSDTKGSVTDVSTPSAEEASSPPARSPPTEGGVVETATGFIDYAEAIAEADDFPQIIQAQRALFASESYKAAPLEQQNMSRRIAAMRNVELAGAGQDPLTNLHAWRNYIEWETREDVLLHQRESLAATAAWKELDKDERGTSTKIALDKAFARRITALRGANPEDFN